MPLIIVGDCMIADENNYFKGKVVPCNTKVQVIFKN